MGIKHVALGIVALAIGIGFYYFWGAFRPADPDSYKVGVGLLGFLLSYAVLYFSTKE